MKIAVCQIFTLDGDRDGNFVRIENALREASQSGAKIACFPETTVLGWINPEAHKRSFPIPGKTSKRISHLANKYDTMICTGITEKSEDNLYNSCVLFNRCGDILLKHQKINVLSELMTPPYTPGEGITTAETEFGTVGILICADTFEKRILKRMSTLDPDLVLVSYGWAAPEDEWPEHGKDLLRTVKETANSIDATVVGTDLIGEVTNGPWSGRVFGGQSLVVNSSGEVLATLADRDREVRIVDIDI